MSNAISDIIYNFLESFVKQAIKDMGVFLIEIRDIDAELKDEYTLENRSVSEQKIVLFDFFMKFLFINLNILGRTLSPKLEVKTRNKFMYFFDSLLFNSNVLNNFVLELDLTDTDQKDVFDNIKQYYLGQYLKYSKIFIKYHSIMENEERGITIKDALIWQISDLYSKEYFKQTNFDTIKTFSHIFVDSTIEIAKICDQNDIYKIASKYFKNLSDETIRKFDKFEYKFE